MGVITDIFKSFYIPSVRWAGSQVVTDIQSISKVGTVTRARSVRRAPRVRPRTRKAGIHRIKRRVVATISKLSRSRQAKFVNRELTRIDSTIKRETKARIPTLRNIQIAGYKYGKAHPNSAKLIYSSGNKGAKIVRNAIPKTVSPSKGMFAFSDGVIHGIRNEPIKTLSETFLKPKDMKPEDLIKRKERLKVWQKKDLPKWVTDFVGDPLKLSERDRKIVLPFYGKTSAEALQQKEAMTSYLNYVGKEIKQNPAKIALFAALPPALRIAGKGIQAAGITRLITKVPNGELITRRTVQLVSAGVGAIYTKDVYDRTTEPVFTFYKDGKTTTTQKTLPNGDIEITTTIKQIPQYRKPTGPEQIERLSGIFATELAPLSISHRIINRGVKSGYTKPKVEKPKVKISTKIKRAGKVIKTTPAKIKTLPKKVKKVPVLKVTPKGKLKILKKSRSQLLKEQAKARGKKRKELQKRLKQVEKDIKAAEKKALKEEVQVLEVTKKGKLKLLRKKRSQLLKDKAKAKGKERKEIQKRLKRVEKELAFKEAFKPSKKVVKLSNSAYNNINRLSKLKAQLKALIAKIKAIPVSIAKRIGLNKSKEIKKINVLIRETDAVKTYIVMIQKGTSRKVIVTHLNKLPANELKVMDTKTGNIIKKIESTTKDIESRVIKPSKKPDVKYKEVEVGKGQVQLQKVKEIQKSVTKTITITKADIKAANAINSKAKTILKTKPKTISTAKIKYKQLQKINTQIKTKRKVLLLYRQQLISNISKLKQSKKLLLILIGKQKLAEKVRTKQTIKIITGQTGKIESVIALITKTTDTVVPIQVTKPEQMLISVPRQRIIPTTKPKLVTIPVPVIIPPAIPPRKKKVEPKKKRKKKKIGVEEFWLKNPIPTLKSLYGY